MLFSLFLLVFVGSYCFAQIKINKTIENGHLKFHVEATSNEFDFYDSLTIVRTPNTANVTIAFPAGGTFSGVRLYEAGDNKGMENPLLKSEGPTEQAPFVLDLSLLHPGSYLIHYTSCGLGGFMKISIQ